MEIAPQQPQSDAEAAQAAREAREEGAQQFAAHLETARSQFETKAGSIQGPVVLFQASPRYDGNERVVPEVSELIRGVIGDEHQLARQLPKEYENVLKAFIGNRGTIVYATDMAEKYGVNGSVIALRRPESV